MVKKHVDTNRPQVVVLLDDRSASYPEDRWFEESVEVAASLRRAGGAVRGADPPGHGQRVGDRIRALRG